MVDSVSNIRIGVDATSGKQSLNELSVAIRGVGSELTRLGKSTGGFSDLQRQISAATSGFDRLKSAAGIGNSLSRDIGKASSDLGVFTSALGGAAGAMKVLGVALGVGSIVAFAKSIQEAGNDLLSFRFALDSVAVSSTEANDQLKFVRETAQSTGGDLDAMTSGYRRLAASMRPLGYSVQTIEDVFKGFSATLTVNHASVAEQKRVWTELSEVFAQGSGHAQQLLRSIGSVVPAMSAQLQRAAGVTGEGLHKMFKEGGVPLDDIVKLAQNLQQQYGPQLSGALEHSTAQINLFNNALLRLKQDAFEGGFDSGLTGLLKQTMSIMNAAGFDQLGEKIGRAFQEVFDIVGAVIAKIYELREPILAVAAASVALGGIAQAFKVASLAAGVLFTPLGMLAVAAGLIIYNWDSLKSALSDGSAFKSASDYISNLTSGWVNLEGAIKGVIGSWELAKGLWQGKSFDDAGKGAVAAMNQFDAGTYGKAAGESYFGNFVSGAAEYAKQVKNIFADLIPTDGLKRLDDEVERLKRESESSAFHGAGAYEENQKRYSAPKDNSLSDSLEKTYERLLPANKALKEFKDTLAQIDQMQGKSFDGKVISDDDLERMKKAAAYSALPEADPAAGKIRDMVEKLETEQKALAAGDKDSSAYRQINELLQIELDLKKKGVELTQQQRAALQQLIAAQDQLNNKEKGVFDSWAKDAKSSSELIASDMKSTWDSVSQGITNLVENGKGKFKSLAQAIRAEFRNLLKGIASKMLKQGFDQLGANFAKQLQGLFGDKNNGLSSAIAAGKASVADSAKALGDAAKSTATMEVQAGVVNINGASLGGAGGIGSGAFGLGGGNPAAAGGITPTAPTAMFANNNTPGLGTIPSNSAMMFGGNGLASPSSITSNSLAEFGKIIGITNGGNPLAAAGLTAGSGLSGNKAMQAMQLLMAQGATPKQASVFAAQFAGESNFNPRIVSKNDAGPGLDSEGLAQWNRDRLVRMKDDLSAQYGKPYNQLSDQELFQGQVKYAWKEAHTGDYRSATNSIGQHPGNEAGHFGGVFEGYDKDTQHGDAWRNAMQQKYESQLSSGSANIQPAQDFTRQMDQASKKVSQDFSKDIGDASKTGSKQLEQTLSTDLTKGLGGNNGATGDLDKLATSIKTVGTDSQNASTGLSSLIGKLSGLGGGALGGAGAGTDASLAAGSFSEGGFSDSPVSGGSYNASLWAGAPHFSEGGTTLPGGGMPAVLHDNEAVVPLSRGREIPVKLSGNQGGGDTHYHMNAHTNVVAKDYDSFRRNSGQLANDTQMLLGRMRARNG